MNDLTEWTIEEYRKASLTEKKRYWDWRKRQKEQDKKEVKNLNQKIHYIKNREIITEKMKKYYQKRKNGG